MAEAGDKEKKEEAAAEPMEDVDKEAVPSPEQTDETEENPAGDDEERRGIFQLPALLFRPCLEMERIIVIM